MRIATDLGARDLSNSTWGLLRGSLRLDGTSAGEPRALRRSAARRRRLHGTGGPGARAAPWLPPRPACAGILASILCRWRRTSWIPRPRCAWVCAGAGAAHAPETRSQQHRELNNFALAEGQLGTPCGRRHLREAVPFNLKQLDYLGRASAGGAVFAIFRAPSWNSRPAARHSSARPRRRRRPSPRARLPREAAPERAPRSMAVVLVDANGKVRTPGWHSSATMRSPPGA